MGTTSAPELTLYYHFLSPPARAAKFMVHQLNIPCNFVEVDIMGKDNRNEWYLKINPNGLVPTLVHNDLTLFESRAIMQYLVHVFAPDSDG